MDSHVIGQSSAKKSLAIAMRNRWRRKCLPDQIRKEVTPKNILISGPTGSGKTELARRLAKLTNAPFIRVEATKFTEVGYVGKDVNTIIQDMYVIYIKFSQDQSGAGQEDERGVQKVAASDHRVKGIQ